ncbi:MAG: S8 family peptidase [Bacteroidales bacterium]|nr:S8 family peptidase [Bacteroidales bacterium]
MKKPFLSIILFYCCLASFAEEPVEVMVQMKARYDRTELCRKAELYPTRTARRDYVVNELKAYAEASQHDLMLTLNELEQQGLVSSISSLWSANAICFTATEEVIPMLMDRPDIESITPVRKHQCIPEAEMASEVKDYSRYTIVPNLTQVNAPQVWAQGNEGQGVVVAVIDSGVNYNHVDIADHLWDGGEEFPHHGWDFANNDDNPMDDFGHGTHCAGIVCGDGTAGLRTGVAPEATLMCIKCTDNEGHTTLVNMVMGMEFAVEHGCDVISMSMGIAKAEVSERELLRHTCEALLDAGIVGLFPAGNEHNLQHLCPIPYNVRVPGSCPPPYLDPDQMVNPGALSCAICVGSVDENDTVASSSSEGPVTWQDTEFGDYAYDPGMGLIRPDVCAPGVIIWSLKYNNIYDYDYMSGTSQATPCVAGIVALMLHENPELTPAAICQILEETSLRLTPVKSNRTGAGRVDALAAVTAAFEWDGVIQQTIESAILRPNPVVDVLYLDVADGTPITVFDMTGRMVKHERYAGQLDLSQLVPGVYSIKVDGLMLRIVKQ